MDSLPMILSSSAIGFIIGRYISKDLTFTRAAAKVASRAVDAFVDLKWSLKSFIDDKEPVQAPLCPEKVDFAWLVETDHYKVYRLNGERYITFNLSHEPVLHFEDGAVEEIMVVRNDGTKVAPSDGLKDIIVQCGGHGCVFAAGVPTLDQLKQLQTPGIHEELEDVKKIIINTTSFDEHIIGGGGAKAI
jgi:hypothetical protein